MRRIGCSLAIVLSAGCVRAPTEQVCPDLVAGDLVVTEVRGPQSPEDQLGTWVELYNASTHLIDLEGVKLRFRKKDGSSEIPVLVRRTVLIDPGKYAVLGLVVDSMNRPDYIDYGFADDFTVGFLPAAAIDVESCGARLDRAVYDVLPKVGTYSLGGEPSADQNDLPTNWCVNATPSGTPQTANPGCI